MAFFQSDDGTEAATTEIKSSGCSRTILIFSITLIFIMVVITIVILAVPSDEEIVPGKKVFFDFDKVL